MGNTEKVSRRGKRNHARTPSHENMTHEQVFTDRMKTLYKVRFGTDDLNYFRNRFAEAKKGSTGPNFPIQEIDKVDGTIIYTVKWNAITVVVGRNKDGTLFPLPGDCVTPDGEFLPEKANLNMYMRAILPVEFLLTLAREL